MLKTCFTQYDFGHQSASFSIDPTSLWGGLKGLMLVLYSFSTDDLNGGGTGIQLNINYLDRLGQAQVITSSTLPGGVLGLTAADVKAIEILSWDTSSLSFDFAVLGVGAPGFSGSVGIIQV